jgi:hypothetical protein
MKEKNHIQEKVDRTFKVLDTIEEVAVSTNFSSKVLAKLKEEDQRVEEKSTWFTPQLQFAAMIIVLILNATVVYYTISSSENASESVSGIEQFAKEYHINSEATFSLN